MVCTGPINYLGMAAVQTDIENFKAALLDIQPQEAFIPAASPGILAQGSWIRNGYYPTTDAFLEALAQAMRQEYQAIVQAGFLLQVDSPDLADLRTMRFWDLSLEEYRKKVAQHVEVLNAALADIPADRVRLHVCWGNYEGPHHADVATRDILDILLQARVQAISIEAANPRHAHEWRIWETVKLPEGKILIPGVIDDKTESVKT